MSLHFEDKELTQTEDLDEFITKLRLSKSKILNL
jgi:hypothetical protein